jgi:hypothetical protein
VVVSLWQRRRVEQIASHLVHRQRGGWILLWMGISAVGFPVKTMLQWGLLLSFFDSYAGTESSTFLGIITGSTVHIIPNLLFGMITGTALIWLLRLPLPEEFES